jgi:hypothetical protein
VEAAMSRTKLMVGVSRGNLVQHIAYLERMIALHCSSEGMLPGHELSLQMIQAEHEAAKAENRKPEIATIWGEP